MNFDAFWQTHRRFILGFVGGVVVFFLLLAMTGNGAEEKLHRSKSTISSTKRKVKTSAMYGSRQLSELQQRLQALQARNQELSAQTLPPFRPRFQIPASTPAAQHYIGLTGALRDELIGWALRHNCEVDESLGLPPVSPSQPQQIERVLHGLDVVERVVRLAVEHGAVEVDKIRIAQKSRRRPGRNRSPLEITPVSMDVVFRRLSATPFLRSLFAEQSAGNPLGLVGMEILPQDGKRLEQHVRLEFGVGQAVSLAEEVQQ